MIKRKFISDAWKRLAILLCLAFAIQIVNKALFYHSHLINGRTYSHAHAGNPDHDHSNQELCFHAQFQVLHSFDATEQSINYLPQVVCELRTSNTLNYNYFRFTDRIGRSPPVI